MHDQFATTELPGAAGRSARPVRWIVVLLTVAVVLVPIISTEGPRETARWYAAAAAVQHDRNEDDQSLRLITEAIELDPESDDLRRVRGSWLVEAGDYEAGLEDLSQAIELDPQEPMNYFERSTALQAAGRFAEAVRDWDKIIELNDEADLLVCSRFLSGNRFRFPVYNARAYARALAGIELVEGLADINRAIKSMGSQGENAAFLDTRGFLLLKLRQPQAALADMDRAVEMVEQDLANWPEILQILRHNEELDQRGLDREIEEKRKSVAVIRYHRGLVHRALGQADAAAADFERVRELGFQPGDQLF